MVEFRDYFLKAQEEAHEVYIGEDIALVVYDQDKMVGICGICEDAMFLSFEELSNLEKQKLANIRTPENRRGIIPGLTEKIRGLWLDFRDFHEFNDANYQNGRRIVLNPDRARHPGGQIRLV